MADTPTPGPGFTPEQAEAATAAQRDGAPPIATGIPPALAARVRSAGGPAETDTAALLSQMQAQMLALAAEVTRLKQGQAGDGAHPLVGTAASIRDMLAVHYDHNPGAAGAPVLRLADDVVDASKNAVESGDVSVVRDLGARLVRALKRNHPGPGDHHWFTQALDFASNHLPEAADTVGAPAPSGAPALGGAAPAPVVAGSVTG
jgi:hypothetical protein